MNLRKKGVNRGYLGRVLPYFLRSCIIPKKLHNSCFFCACSMTQGGWE
jgi:hypothetical protein